MIGFRRKDGAYRLPGVDGDSDDFLPTVRSTGFQTRAPRVLFPTPSCKRRRHRELTTGDGDGHRRRLARHTPIFSKTMSNASCFASGRQRRRCRALIESQIALLFNSFGQMPAPACGWGYDLAGSFRDRYHQRAVRATGWMAQPISGVVAQAGCILATPVAAGLHLKRAGRRGRDSIADRLLGNWLTRPMSAHPVSKSLAGLPLPPPGGRTLMP